MKRLLLLAFAVLGASAAHAEPSPPDTPGMVGFREVKRCVMENDAGFCRSILTPASFTYLQKFQSYDLMPCLPTDFTYDREKRQGTQVTVRTVAPINAKTDYVLRLVFDTGHGKPLLDLPASFAAGFGPQWQSRLQMSEQLYLMMRQNAGGKISCDTLAGLLQ